MKKLLAVCLCLSMLITAFAGCTKDKKSDNVPSSNDSSTTVESNTSISDKEIILNMGKKIQEENQLLKVFCELGRDGEKLDEKKNPYASSKYHTNYCLVNSFNSKNELKNYILSLVSKRKAENLYFKYFEGEYGPSGDFTPPFIIEVEGKLYADDGRMDAGDGVGFDYDSIKILKLGGTNAEIEITGDLNGDIIPFKMSLVKENGNWVIDKSVDPY